jgi:hypothetical protein
MLNIRYMENEEKREYFHNQASDHDTIGVILFVMTHNIFKNGWKSSFPLSEGYVWPKAISPL